jgi:nucleoside-diphosphate-sugar epimerase
MDLTFKKVAISGGKGFLGSNFASYLKRRHPHVETCLVPEDITRPVHTEKVVRYFDEQRPDAYFHFMGKTNCSNEIEFFEQNTEPLKSILDAIFFSAVSSSCKVVVPGSAAEYGNQKSGVAAKETDALTPLSLYGRMKCEQFHLTQKYDNKLIILYARLFNVIAPLMPKHFAIGNYMHQICFSAREIHTGNLSAHRDFVFIDDLCRALCLLVEVENKSEVYNIASQVPVLMKDVLFYLAEKYSKIPPDQIVIVENKELKPGDILYSLGDYTRLKKKTGWTPEVFIEAALSALVRPERP